MPDPNLDTVLKRIARIEHQLRHFTKIADELILAKKMLQNKENRRLLKRMKKVKDVKKAFPKILAMLKGK